MAIRHSWAMLMPETQTVDAEAAGCLKGARCWLITAGKAGMLTQANGIAAVLGLDAELKIVEPKGLWRMMAPWGPVAPAERFGEPGTPFAPPWPDIAIAVGRASIPYIRALRRRAGPQCFTVVLQDPRSGPDTADLIWVPAHDRRRGANVITTVISPHGWTLEKIEELRQRPAPEIDRLPSPRVAVLLGGRNSVYKYTTADHERLAVALKSVSDLGASLLVTASRRSHAEIVDAVAAAVGQAPGIFWRSDADGPNPYPDFLAKADCFVVTADSVNMAGEVCATGRPVYIFHPAGGSAKFNRFHASLEEMGASRPLPDRVEQLETWSYAPQVTAQLIAHEIERRYWARKKALPGLRPDNGRSE